MIRTLFLINESKMFLF